MAQTLDFRICPISGIRIEKNFAKYNFSARVGSYCTLDYTLRSNQRHYHDCYELVLVVSGRGTFIHGNSCSVLSAGDFFISEPDSEHEIHVNLNESLIVLYFMIDIRKKLNSKAVTTEEKILDCFMSGHVNTVTGKKHLMSYVYFFESYVTSRTNQNLFWIVKALESFIFECLEQASTCSPRDITYDMVYGSTLEKAMDFIDQNLDKKLSAQEIALHVCTSKRNLYNLFARNLKRPVNDYVNHRKIDLAAHYLNMNINVTDAARLVSIDSISMFNKLFRKYMSLSPSEYRKKLNLNKSGYGRRLLKP